MKWVWKTTTLERLHNFFWLVVHDCVLDKCREISIGLEDISLQKLCNRDIHDDPLETTLHIPYNCPCVVEFWKGFLLMRVL